jgi:Tol biopolymer transport system component
MRPARGAFFAALVAFFALPAVAHAVATDPGANGRIGFRAGNDIWAVNPDGTGAANLTSSSETESCPMWSPNGAKIAFVRSGAQAGIWVMNADGSAPARLPTKPSGLSYEIWGCTEDWSPDSTKVTFTYDDHCDAGGVYNLNVDGSGMTQVACGPPICQYDTTPEDPDWSPDGQKMALVGCTLVLESDLWTINTDGSGMTHVVDTPGTDQWEMEPEFSPTGAQLLYVETDWDGLHRDTYKINADGTGKTRLLTISTGGGATWSPDGTKIAFYSAGDLWTMNTDGSNKTNITNHPSNDACQTWSPDSQKIAFCSNRDGDNDIYVMNRDGTNQMKVAGAAGVSETPFGWQPLIRYYPRPKGATPVLVSLVTAFEECTGGNTTHGGPLDAPSCSPPSYESDYVTPGTFDVNAKAPRMLGSVRLDTVAGNSATSTDDADVTLRADIVDVRRKSDAEDYTGELQAILSLGLTDRYNAYGGAPGTAADVTLPFTVSCAATTDTIGATCAVSTTADTVLPGAVPEAKRAIWELGQVEVFDGGADGVASTSGDNALFARQGIFIP